MSSVRIVNGIGFGSNAIIVSKNVSPNIGGTSFTEANAPVSNTTLKDQYNNAFPWMPWGTNNQMPLEMLKNLEGCGILNSIISSQARMAIGDGVKWAYTRRDKTGATIVEDMPVIPELDEFMEDNNHYRQEWAWMQDLKGYSHGATRYVLNSQPEPKIVSFRRDDITELRYQKLNTSGIVENIYLCAEWEKINSEKDNRILKVPLINDDQPIISLRDYAKAGQKQLALTFKPPTWNKKYYPIGAWQTVQDWINIERKIPKMKDAMFDHNFRPRYQVTIFEEFWTNRFNGDGDSKNWGDYTDQEKEAMRQKVYDDIDLHLAGVENHGKAIYVSGKYNDQTGKAWSEIEIKAIDDLIKEGDMLPESATAISVIAFAMMYNPAIIGASLPSGPYTNSQGGSNVRESVTVQILIHEPERQLILRNYNIIKRFNGWDTAYAKTGLRLEPIMPTTILTTLDTGAGTKPAIPGAAPAEKPNNTPT